MVGYKRVGWSKDQKKVGFEVLVKLDSEIERDAFIGFLDSLMIMLDLRNYKEE